MGKEKEATTCAVCNRVVYTTDVDEHGKCCDCTGVASVVGAMGTDSKPKRGKAGA